MIINGNSRSNGRWFTTHLTRLDTNDRVTLCEVRGLAAEDIRTAFREMAAVASGTRCTNHFYHANINPEQPLTAEQWELAIAALEKELDFTGQARFVVEHEKSGRTHRHVVWSRIDPETMKAIPDGNNYHTHMRVSRELETLFGHAPVNEPDRTDPKHGKRDKDWEQFRQKERDGKDPKAVKAEVTGLWERADSALAFKSALEQHGYILCRGDRRDFV